MTQEPRGNIVRIVLWSAIIVIVLGVLLSIAARAQDMPPISEQHCCRLWLPVVAAQCEVCPAGYTWADGGVTR